MRFYFDKENLEDFLNIVLPDDKKLSSEQYSLYELGLSIKKKCQVSLLPLSDESYTQDKDIEKLSLRKEEIFKKRNEKWNKLTNLQNHKNKKCHNQSPINEKYLQWLRNGDSPYETQEILIDAIQNSKVLAKVKHYTSVMFASHDKEGIVDAHDIPCNMSIHDFLKGLLINEDNTSSKIFYTADKRNWSDFIEESLPLTEVIIVDPYFFTQKDRNLNSSFNLLRQIIGSNKNIKVFMFCKAPEISQFGISPNYSDIYDELKKEYEGQNISFSFILHSSKETKESLHDRYIITNQRLYFSGHSFVNYFDDDRQSMNARGGTWFNVNTFVDQNNEFVLTEIVENALNRICEHSCYGECFGDNVKSEIIDVPTEGFITVRQWNDFIETGKSYLGKEITPDIKSARKLKMLEYKKCKIIFKKPEYFDASTKLKLYKISFNNKYSSEKSYPFFSNDYTIIRD